MLLDVLPEHELRHTLFEAERMLRKGIVEQSLTLGFAPIILDDATLPPVAEAEPEPPIPAIAPRKRNRKPKPAEPDPVAAVETTVTKPRRAKRQPVAS
jgi:hypothetical protein